MAAASRSTLLAFCRSLPHATEDIKWGADLVFSIGAKMFASFWKDGDDATFGCKVADEDFPVLTGIEGIVPAPYAARYHWVKVDDPKVLPEREAIALLRGSYELVKAKLPMVLQRKIDGASSASGGGKGRAPAMAPAKQKPKAAGKAQGAVKSKSRAQGSVKSKSPAKAKSAGKAKSAPKAKRRSKT